MALVFKCGTGAFQSILYRKLVFVLCFIVYNWNIINVCLCRSYLWLMLMFLLIKPNMDNNCSLDSCYELLNMLNDQIGMIIFMQDVQIHRHHSQNLM